MFNKLYVYIAGIVIAIALVAYLGIKSYINNEIYSRTQTQIQAFMLESQNKAIATIALDTKNYLQQSPKIQQALIQKYNAIPSIEVTSNSIKSDRAKTALNSNKPSSFNNQSSSNQINLSDSKTLKELMNEVEFPSIESILFPNQQQKTLSKDCQTQLKEVQNALDLFFNTPHTF